MQIVHILYFILFLSNLHVICGIDLCICIGVMGCHHNALRCHNVTWDYSHHSELAGQSQHWLLQWMCNNVYVCVCSLCRSTLWSPSSLMKVKRCLYSPFPLNNPEKMGYVARASSFEKDVSLLLSRDNDKTIILLRDNRPILHAIGGLWYVPSHNAHTESIMTKPYQGPSPVSIPLNFMRLSPPAAARKPSLSFCPGNCHQRYILKVEGKWE